MTMPSQIIAKDLAIGYEGRAILEHLDFEVTTGEIFIVMGGSGSGKSTLLRNLIGLSEPLHGDIRYGDAVFTGVSADQRREIARRFGVLYQSSALWSAMTLAENVALPIEEFTRLGPTDVRELARLKLALVGLRGFEDFYPSQISGGMQKRAGLARAMALDPAILFLDEPSSGLDPVTAHHLDQLILELRDSLGITFVVVTHELASIFLIGTDSIFLDADSRSAIAHGSPRELLEKSQDPRVRRFLTRDSGEETGGQS
jgi:phospholipid/cholesterol/gamma-HCH transport system ATP-binding protein